MRVLSVFTGMGGFDLAAEWAGFEIVGQIEIDSFCNKVLKKHWPNVKRMRDIKDVKGDEFGPVDILCGGPPCQPASCAGKRRGEKDDRWLWGETLRLVRTIKPSWCLFENPTGILSLQGGIPFESLLLDLEEKDYIVQAFVLPAASVGAPHRRDRVWIVGYSRQQREGREGKGFSIEQFNRGTQREWAEERHRPSDPNCHAPDTASLGLGRRGEDGSREQSGLFRESLQQNGWQEHWYEVAQRFCSLDHGLPEDLARPGRNRYRIQKLKALGNSIVPQIAFQIFKAIKEITLPPSA